MIPLIKKLSKNHIVQFFTSFAAIFFITALLLIGTGIAPSELSGQSGAFTFWDSVRLFVIGADTGGAPVISTGAPAPSASSTLGSVSAQGGNEAPIRLVIANAGVDSVINNPTSSDIDYLDTELSKGPIHYPGSAYPGEQGNMFIFGHSTGFSVVHNPAYKVFNDIHTLAQGDSIQVYTVDYVYTYTVTDVKKVDKNDTWVNFNSAQNTNTITISTCDSFGKKTDRYVVQGLYVGRSAVS